MIGRLHHVIIDCPEPNVLAQFYSELLGMPVTYQSATFAVVARSETSSGIGFQRVAEYHPPAWPDPDSPQQFHCDVMVDDLDSAEQAVLALGAKKFSQGDHVYADPVGHPFCLVPRPGWASPISPSIQP
ncbi:MAG: glyoxalase [Microbacteriaceae bacterium]|nr:glyoxalase [Microbacteriaceae bacterium]